MDNPNITIEEYIRLEEEKARRRGKVYNWETATYGKIWDNKDVYDLGSVESEFPAIVLKNNNKKVNMPSFPPPEPTVSCLNDLDFFKDFEKEFPTIVYNDALTSKSNFSTEPTLGPKHIDEFDLKDETSLSECDEEEQNVSIRRILGYGYGVSTSCTVLGPRERNIDEYWWRIYKSGDLEVLES
ncbi:hypothetical protein Tco_1252343 [Tanacetum coccineum]